MHLLLLIIKYLIVYIQKIKHRIREIQIKRNVYLILYALMIMKELLLIISIKTGNLNLIAKIIHIIKY